MKIGGCLFQKFAVQDAFPASLYDGFYRVSRQKAAQLPWDTFVEKDVHAAFEGGITCALISSRSWITWLLRLVKTIQLCSFIPGEYVFKQGSRGDALFIVYEGTVAVCIKRLPEQVIVTLGPNQFFGEMALLSSASSPNAENSRIFTAKKSKNSSN